MPLSMPRVAFATTCGNRLPHLRETLRPNIEANRDYPNAVHVVLDYGSSDGLMEWITTAHERDIRSGRLVVYRYPDARHFHMAHAKNMAHRLAIHERGEILVGVDADNTLPTGFAAFLATRFLEAYLDGDDVFLSPGLNHVGPGRNITARTPPGSNGRIAVTRDQFRKAGGYDERFNFYGPDDKDFDARLRRIGYGKLLMPTRYLGAKRHPDKIRFRNYAPGGPKSREDVAEAFRLQGRKEVRVVNGGRIGVGKVIKVERPNQTDWEALYLAPIPTRIFGIGFHKTASTSLAKALEILDLDPVHWVSAQWAKAVDHELEDTGRSVGVEQFYSALDFPIPLHYRALDANYPGAKFILTVRDTKTWLGSVERHWERLSSTWEEDPYTDRLHEKIYGRKTFDRAVMAERYERHNREVIAYFKDRPDDLLVMDMSNGDGWRKLCRFLNLPVPRLPYPVEYVTEVPVPMEGYPR